MAISDLYYLDAEGLHAPEYQVILDFFLDQYRSIYGEDSYLETDSKDYELAAVYALALYDTMQTNVQIYNGFSPQTGEGDSLTRNVAINGLQRAIPTYSSVDLTIVGTIGTTIAAGYAKDAQEQKWMLPENTVIGSTGSETVTATADEIGAVDAAIGTITIIGTPTRGWSSVTNAAAAVAGEAVETDAGLRIRQTISTMFSSQSIFEGLVAAVAAVTGVTRYIGYENDTAATVASISAYSIAVVVEGGDVDEIAEAIFNKKSIGCGTDGDVNITVQDSEGYETVINFYRPTEKAIDVTVTLSALTGWLTTTEDVIAAAVKAAIDALVIGEDVLYTKLFTPANLGGTALGETFNLTSIKIILTGGTPAETDISIDFDELATLALADITITAS